jgi:Lon protease-like protein
MNWIFNPDGNRCWPTDGEPLIPPAYFDGARQHEAEPTAPAREARKLGMKIALFPLDVVLFPGALLPLHIFEERYKEMVSECLDTEAEFGVVRVQSEGLAVVGCAAGIIRVLRRYDDGQLDILCEGRRRFEIEQLDNTRSFLQAQIDYFEDEPLDSSREARAACLAMHLEVLSLAGVGRESYSFDLDKGVSFQLGWELPSDLGFKQRLLTSTSDRERTELLHGFYDDILPKLRRGANAQKNGGGGTVM